MGKKIVIKFSGEFIIGSQAVNLKKALAVASEIGVLAKRGYKIGIVIGAGNIFRGRTVKGDDFPRIEADYIGMLGSLVNAQAMHTAFSALGLKSRVESVLAIPSVIEAHNPAHARKRFAAGEIIIFAGGIGLPYFSTDTAAVELALELRADVLYKATKVAGVYEKDPKKYPQAKKFSEITLAEALDRKLKIMDQTAMTLARDNNLPIFVFKWQKGAAEKLINGGLKGTWLKG